MVNFDLPFLSVQIVNSRLDIKLKLEEIKLIAITTREVFFKNSGHPTIWLNPH